MNKIVTDLLDFARPMKPEHSVISLQRTIDETLAEIKKPDNVKITTRIDKSQKILADSQLIKKAFTNIMTNAIQAMPDGGTLTIAAEDNNEGTVIRFKDTGMGMSPHVLKNLFKPLITNKAKGMGMGLVVVKNIIDAHKGRINVKSEAGKGTTFAFTMPTRCDPNDKN
jgi:signal transduction histidine kinase